MLAGEIRSLKSASILILMSWKGPGSVDLEVDMRRPTSEEFSNAFLWLAVLAGSIILFWGSDRLWMMIVIVLANGFASMGIVTKGGQQPN